MCVDGACSGPSVPPIAGETNTINQPYVYIPHTSDAPQLFSHLPAGVPRWRSLKKTSQRKDENNVPKSSRDTPAVLPGGRPHGPGRSRRTLRYQQRVHARRRHTATNDSGCRDDRCAARGRCLCQSRRRRTRSKRVRFTYNMHSVSSQKARSWSCSCACLFSPCPREQRRSRGDDGPTRTSALPPSTPLGVPPPFPPTAAGTCCPPPAPVSTSLTCVPCDTHTYDAASVGG